MVLKRLLLLACAWLAFVHAPAQAQRLYQSAELEAMLAPVALYPDPLLTQILTAATHPAEVMEAAGQPLAENPAWDPSVQALRAYPELLSQMAASPQWMFDLGNAWLAQGAQVLEAVQVLRQRAQASGSLRSTDHHEVQRYGPTISVLPAIPQVVYVPYYDPLVVYGAWRPAYRTVHWRAWPTRRVFVSNHFRAPAPQPNGPPSPAARMQARNATSHVSNAPPAALRGNGPPSPAAQMQGVKVSPYVRTPEANRQPIVQSAPRLQKEAPRQHHEHRHDHHRKHSRP